MTIIEEVVGTETGRSFPMDLRAWMPSEPLLRLVLASVAAARLPMSVEGPGLGLRRMLALVTYSYATGRVGSPEICLNLKCDSVLEVITGGTELSWHVIRSFRRGHRVLIEQCLARVLAEAAQANEFLAVAPAVFVDPMLDQHAASLRNLSEAEKSAVLEATDRVSRAIQMDSMAMDE